ncbi:hypothetical protein A2U01_0088530, partial [Trifolium medium]|nr:hypothetical protein [Trifolium medium]
MSFWSERRWITLQGVCAKSNNGDALQSMLSRRHGGLLWSLDRALEMDPKDQLSGKQHAELQDLLSRYEEVFAE